MEICRELDVPPECSSTEAVTAAAVTEVSQGSAAVQGIGRVSVPSMVLRLGRLAGQWHNFRGILSWAMTPRDLVS